ncbi:putative GNAT superfamily acetyltransferase [Bacillus mesophilus]|uniref:GNAT family N-acetyltransferase n=1 Tax=Bacillus mesophilus TaxID=1808955 RepID=UPI0030B7F9E7|nr:putative GNAT superfamily acetyltransferase [Bacillus mesophilus]
MLHIKTLTTLQEVKSVQAVEEQVWNSPSIPEHQIYTAIQNGGILLGAYLDNNLIGFLYSFPGYKEGSIYLCSHMLGILPGYRKSGIGHQLKEKQRELALQKGYSLITWTFDPLESVNAYLNIHKLKGITGSYLENHYGNLNDSLNQGMPTDRFLVEWWINSKHVNDENTNSLSINEYKALIAIEQDKLGFPYIVDTYNQELSQNHYLVPVPENFQQIKKDRPELAMEWRLETRTQFQKLLSKGYVAADIRRESKNGVSYYVFSLKNSLSI